MLRTVEFNALVTVGVVLALATGLLTGRYTIAAASGPDDDHVHSAQFCVVGGGPGGLQARPSSAPRRLCFHSFFTPPLDSCFLFARALHRYSAETAMTGNANRRTD